LIFINKPMSGQIIGPPNRAGGTRISSYRNVEGNDYIWEHMANRDALPLRMTPEFNKCLAKARSRANGKQSQFLVHTTRTEKAFDELVIPIGIIGRISFWIKRSAN